MIEDWKLYFLTAGIIKGCLISQLLFNIIFDGTVITSNKMEWKDWNWKRSKSITFTADIIIHRETSKDLPQDTIINSKMSQKPIRCLYTVKIEEPEL